MQDAVDPVRLDDPGDEGAVGDIARDKHRRCRHALADTGGEIVEDHRRLAGVEELEDRVAADVARSSGDQNRHAVRPQRRPRF